MTPLTPDYTFQTFLVTPYNEMARDASKAIAEDPGVRYNPFFLSGPFGSGKTHLLHAIGNAIEQDKNYLRVTLVRGRDLAADIARAVKKHKLTNFYHAYGACELLLIDGFEAVRGDDHAQNVAIRLIDDLVRRKRQVVIASALPFREFPVIERYFLTSYDRGLVAEVLAPEALVKHRELLWE